GWSSSRRSKARAPHDRHPRAGSGSTPHDPRHASRLAPSIASASSRAPEHERNVRGRSPILLRPMRTPRSRPSSPSKTAAVGASAENAERGPLPTPRSPALRDPQIPIVALAKRLPYLPAVSSLGGFRAPAPAQAPPSQRAGARNPSPTEASRVPVCYVRNTSSPAVRSALNSGRLASASRTGQVAPEAVIGAESFTHHR